MPGTNVTLPIQMNPLDDFASKQFAFGPGGWVDPVVLVANTEQKYDLTAAVNAGYTTCSFQSVNGVFYVNFNGHDAAIPVTSGTNGQGAVAQPGPRYIIPVFRAGNKLSFIAPAACIVTLEFTKA